MSREGSSTFVSLEIAREIESTLAEYGGELVPDLATRAGDLPDKIAGCLAVLGQLEAESAALTAWIDKLTRKRLAKFAAMKQLTAQMQVAMKRSSCTHLDTAFGSARLHQVRQVVVDHNFCETAPAEYVLTTKEPKLRKIGDALRRGVDVPGAGEVEVEQLVII